MTKRINRYLIFELEIFNFDKAFQLLKKAATAKWGVCVNRQYRSTKYGGIICAAYKDKDIFNKYLDLHYKKIKKSHA